VEEEEILTGDGFDSPKISAMAAELAPVAVDACSHQHHNGDQGKVGNENVVRDAIDSIIPSKYHISHRRLYMAVYMSRHYCSCTRCFFVLYILIEFATRRHMLVEPSSNYISGRLVMRRCFNPSSKVVLLKKTLFLIYILS
jgi:hypothetical protein